MTTLKDIALKAGVNISTVSKALNNSSEIGEETKKYIKSLAVKMNYIPDIHAKALAGKGTKSIGVIVPEISSNYFAKMLSFIELELKKNAYSLIVGMAHHKYKNELTYLDVFYTRKVDGIIVAGSMYKEINGCLENIQKNKIPIVLIHTFIPYDDDNFDYIIVDDMYGINSAIKFLKKQGHKKIGYVADELSSRFRLSIFKDAIIKNGLNLDDRFIKIGTKMFEIGGYLQMKNLLEENELPTAVLASYDYIAIGAMKALNEKGLRVPDDMSIIGYDNIRESAFLTCPLTTISPPVEQMSKIGINILLNKIKDKDYQELQHISLKPKLIIRSSTSKCSKG